MKNLCHNFRTKQRIYNLCHNYLNYSSAISPLLYCFFQTPFCVHIPYNMTQRNFWDKSGRIYKGAFCAYLCLIFDRRLGKTKYNFFTIFPFLRTFYCKRKRVWYRRLWKIFCKSYPISISNYLHNFLTLPFNVFKQLNFLFREGGGKPPPHSLPLNR